MEAKPKPPAAAPEATKPKKPFVRQPHLTHRPFAEDRDMKDFYVFLKAVTPVRRRYQKGKKA